MLVILAGDGTLLGNTTTWVAVSFIAFIGLLLYYGVPGLIGKALDERAEGIRRELDEARRLRDEAQELLADYQRRANEAEADAKKIVEQAQAEAQALAAETHRNLQEMLERQSRLAEEKIGRAEQQALSEVHSAAVDAAIAAAARVIGSNMTSELNTRLIDESIKDVRGKLN